MCAMNHRANAMPTPYHIRNDNIAEIPTTMIANTTETLLIFYLIEFTYYVFLLCVLLALLSCSHNHFFALNIKHMILNYHFWFVGRFCGPDCKMTTTETKATCKQAFSATSILISDLWMELVLYESNSLDRFTELHVEHSYTVNSSRFITFNAFYVYNWTRILFWIREIER